MTYQTFKYFFVRVGISIFLMGIFGFMILYFFHEVASTAGRIDDDILHWILAAVFLFFGFVVYGLWGERRFEKALKELRDIEANEDEIGIVVQFERLISFTHSSFFLPGMGRNLRDEVIKEYADYLHSMGKDDAKALRIYLKAYLQDPKDSRFRLPILAALKRQSQLPGEEIDLLLLMFKTGKVEDKNIASHLADIFMSKDRFNQKTEPVFIRAIESELENSTDVARFVLPRLLKKNRTDEYALKFFLKSLPYAGSSSEHIKLTLSKSFCEGHWESVDPDLHAQCGIVFKELTEKQKEELTKEVLNNKVDERWKKVKLFGDEDLETLRRLQFRFGVVRSGWVQIKEGVRYFTLFLKKGTKRVLLSVIDLLIQFGRLGLGAKLSTLFIIVLGGVIFFQIQKSPRQVAPSVPPKKITESSLDARPQKQNKIEYTLQIAATTRKKQADKMTAKLKKKGVDRLYVVKTARRGGGHWFKIRVGSFSDQEKAKQLGVKLAGQKLIQNYFVIANKKRTP
jgi:hypothetical protein